MKQFADKFVPMNPNHVICKVITKQLRRNKIKVRDKWFKDFSGICMTDDDTGILTLILFNKRTKQFFSTCSVCHSIDNFSPNTGVRICASRMASHTDFVESIKKDEPYNYILDYLNDVRCSFRV